MLNVIHMLHNVQHAGDVHLSLRAATLATRLTDHLLQAAMRRPTIRQAEIQAFPPSPQPLKLPMGRTHQPS